MQPNKALQLTPSRTAPVYYDHSVFPFTSFLELVRPFGVAELGVRPEMKIAIIPLLALLVGCATTTSNNLSEEEISSIVVNTILDRKQWNKNFIYSKKQLPNGNWNVLIQKTLPDDHQDCACILYDTSEKPIRIIISSTGRILKCRSEDET